MTLTAFAPVVSSAEDQLDAALGGLALDTTAAPGRFVVVHTLATVTGVSLNRDMDGIPKRITYGGCDRLRVSAQAKLRAARTWSRDYLAARDRAARTRLLPGQIATRLREDYGHDPAQSGFAAAAIVAATGMGIDWTRPERTTAIMFIPDQAAHRMARLVHEHWDELGQARDAAAANIDATQVAARRTRKPPRTQTTAAAAEATTVEDSGESEATEATEASDVGAVGKQVPGTLRTQALAAFDPSDNLEIALYGRMLANIAGANTPSGVQAAHLMSVDPIQEVIDDFTVLDDWQGDAQMGAANQGVQYLASGTLYGYFALDRAVLATTLSGHPDPEQAARTAERLFVAAMAWSVPSGGRSRTGSTVAPTLVLAATTNMALSAAPAFETAIPAPAGVAASHRLCQYLRQLQRRVPLLAGQADWLSPDGSAPPPLPDTVAWTAP